MKGRLSDALSLNEGIRLRQAEPEDDEQNRRACAEPKQRSPPMATGVHERPCKNCREKISHYISNLKNPRDETTSRKWTIFECCGDSIAIHASHCNTKQLFGIENLVTYDEIALAYRRNKTLTARQARNCL